MPDLLLHICCGPCSVHSVDRLRREGFDVQGFFYNPNIHPYKEHQRRLETLEGYAKQVNLPLTVCDRYDLDEFLARIVDRIPRRCPICYEMRLRKTAEEARNKGIRTFGTTLMISSYQNQEAIREVGHRLAFEYGLQFHDEDMRDGFRDSQQRAREMGLYVQPYCGCIFSERDRYRKRKEEPK